MGVFLLVTLHLYIEMTFRVNITDIRKHMDSLKAAKYVEIQTSCKICGRALREPVLPI